MKTKTFSILAAILAASVMLGACGAPAMNTQLPNSALTDDTQLPEELVGALILADQMQFSPVPAESIPTSPATPTVPAQSPTEAKTPISLDKALALVLEQLGIAEAALTDKDFDLERGMYELEFTANGMEYEYKVDAFTGDILKAHAEPDNDLPPTPAIPAVPSAPAETVKPTMTREEALQMALDHLKITREDISRLEIEFEDGIFELEFRIGNTKYDFEISATTGRIVDMDQETKQERPPEPSKPADSPKSPMNHVDALALVLQHLGITEAEILRKEIEFDDGKFELEIKVGNTEYEFEVNAATGKVVETDREIDKERPSKPAEPEKPGLTAEAALQMVLDQLGLTKEQIRELEFDFDKGKFELEFKVGNTEYEFELSITGKILKSEKEEDND